MSIIYSNEKKIESGQLGRLFKSVNWVSGDNPEKLSKAIANHSTVYTAWDNNILVGLISVFDDSELNAHITYLLIDPKYQHIGVGSHMLKMVIEKYKTYLNFSLTSNQNTVKFYNKLNFKLTEDAEILFYNVVAANNP